MVDKQQVIAWNERRAEAAMLLDWSREGIPLGFSEADWNAMPESDKESLRSIRRTGANPNNNTEIKREEN